MGNRSLTTPNVEKRMWIKSIPRRCNIARERLADRREDGFIRTFGVYRGKNVVQKGIFIPMRSMDMKKLWAA